MKGVLRTALFFLVFAAIAACTTIPTVDGPYSISDAELVEKVVQSSPWRGYITAPFGLRVELEFAFSKDKKGRLQGELLKTSSPYSGTGGLRWVEIKDGKLSFTSPNGTDCELSLYPDGRLAGSWRLGSYVGDFSLVSSK